MIYLQRLDFSSPVYWNSNLYFFTNQTQQEPLSLQTSAQVPGHYVFVPPNTVPTPGLLQKIKDSLLNQNSVLLMWIENPEEPAGAWRVHRLDSFGAGEERTLSSGAKLVFGGFHILLPGAKAYVEENGFRFTGGMVSAYTIQSDSSQIELILQAGGDKSGLLTFSFVVNAGAEDVFRKIHAGLRYDVSMAEGGKAAVWSWPLQKKGSCSFQACLDPCNLWDPDRTFFELPRESCDSSFCTPEGAPLTLTPERGARLVFEKGLEEDWRLGPCGPFTVGGGEKILCGLKGTEAVKLSQCPTKILEFVPHQSAYLDSSKETTLSSRTTTAWIRFPDRAFYSGQAIDSAYFCLDGAETDAMQNLLWQMEIRAADHTGRVPEVPVLPYSFAQATREQAALLEACLYRTRCKIFLDEIPPVSMPKNEPVTKGASSHGLLAEVQCATGCITRLDLGVSGSSANAVCLPRISGEINRRMQEGEFFLVYEEPQSFSKDFFASSMSSNQLAVSADKWSFEFQPEIWRTGDEETNTAVILKYTNQTSLYDAMKDSPILKKSLRVAYEQDRETIRPEYRDFVRMVHEPGFQGTMILNCPLKAENLPEFLQVIVGDIPPDKLYAHHVVVGVSRLGINNGIPVQEFTSIDALVDFEGGEPLVTEGKPALCDFTTLKLKLMVKDSKLVSFESTSELLVNSFFGSACTRSNTDSGNCLVLDGTCHDKGDEVEYSFALRDEVEFGLSNNAVETVLVNSVGLSVGSAGEQVFTLGGSLRFALVDDCDFFCYGRGKEEQDGNVEQTGLGFTGIRYRIPKEGAPLAEYTDVLVHVQNALPRAQSFGDRFPCELTGFVSGKGNTPDSLGYNAINSPAWQAPLEDEWYGLDWRIDLGTLGGLSNVEGVYLHLLSAWSGASGGNAEFPCYYGAKVPAAQADAFGVQGIAKIGFQSVEVRLEQPQKAPQEDETPQAGQDQEEPKKFELRLHNFNLKLLGIPLIPGSSDIIVFLDETGGQKRLGWFAAYENEKKQEEGKCSIQG